MRRILLMSALALAATAYSANRSDAVVVECANCADIIGQIQSYAMQVQQKITEAATLQTSLNSYAQLVRSGVSLPQSVWTNVQGDIQQVRSIASAGSLLAGNSGGILNRLNNAQGYANQAGSLPQNISGQFAMWNQTLGNAGTTLGRVAAVQQQQEVQYAAVQAQANVHSATAVGQLQAIQASNEQLSIVATQLNQVQSTLSAAAQETAARNLVQDDRQALADAYTTQFFSPPPLPMNDQPEY